MKQETPWLIGLIVGLIIMLLIQRDIIIKKDATIKLANTAINDCDKDCQKWFNEWWILAYQDLTRKRDSINNIKYSHGEK